MSAMERRKLNVISWASVGSLVFVAVCILYLGIHSLSSISHAASVPVAPDGSLILPEVDLSHTKSVVTLALSAAVSALGLCYYLVRQLMSVQRDSINALMGIKEELQKRPCAMKEFPNR